MHKSLRPFVLFLSVALATFAFWFPQGQANSSPRAFKSPAVKSASPTKPSFSIQASPSRDRRSPDGLWQDTDDLQLLARASGKPLERNVAPVEFRAVTLNRQTLAQTLRQAPMEFTEAARTTPTILTLPMPDGTFARFRVMESPIMESGLAAKYPEMKTYSGQGIDDPTAIVRFDTVPQGFHAMILSGHGTTYIDPYLKNDTSVYASYYKRNFRKDAEPFRCLFENQAKDDPQAAHLERSFQPNVPTGANLRVYRTAVATTGEYTAAAGGGTVNGALGAVITTMNRVSGVYEREVAIRLTLVNNEDQIIYTNGATDPYTNDDGFTMLGQNQSNLDSVIGSANYDIGHVFSTGGGGVAGLGVVCRAGQKGRGVTGLPNPVGDPYDIDFVAHEMGHQFGGSHPFNAVTDNCGGNRNATTAYEVGSGSTIQAYAGICGVSDLQPNSDDYFHTISYQEIDTYTSTGLGNCANPGTPTGNTPPTVNAPAATTIPNQTPFTLTATGNDADGGDVLTYCWEEFDLGPAQNPTLNPRDNGSSPIFRSYDPTTNPTRTFPALQYILNNQNVPPATISLPGVGGTFASGEFLPTTDRTMTFRVTIRDNRLNGGGVNRASTTVTSTTTAGPFVVTAPNTAISQAINTSLNVTWNVAGTTANGVNTANVKISLSTDGGLTFPTVLAASTPNDGSESVLIPNNEGLATTQARVKVEAVGNIFFDVSDVNFTITGTNTPPTLNITGSATIRRGSPAASTNVATVGDTQDGAVSLAVTSSNVPPELKVTPTNTGGTVSVSVSAKCSLVTTNTSKTYPVTLTVTDSAGATTSGTLNIVVQPNLSPTLGTYANPATIASGQSTSATPSAPPADANNAIDTVTVSPTTLPGGGTISVDSAGVVSVVTVPATTNGTYTVRVTAQDICGAAVVQSFTLTISGVVACPTITGTPTVTGTNPICAGSSTTVQVVVTGGTPPYSVTLSNGGGTQNGTSPFTFNVSPSATTGYTVSGSDSASCAITNNGTATVTVSQQPTTANAGPDQTICTTGGVLAANAPVNGTGAWSVVAGPSTSSGQFGNTAVNNTTFTPAGGTGTYTLRWTISNPPCTASTDDVVLTVNAGPTTSNAGPDQTICQTGNATLAANTPSIGVGAWSVVTGPSTASGQFGSTSNPTTTFTPAGGAGNYTLRWTISSAPCTPSTDDVVITVRATPTTSNAGPDQTLCVTSPTATLAANTPANGTGAWSVVTAPGGGSTSSAQFSNTASPTSTFTPSPAVAGAYTLRWTISNSPCTASTDDVVITYNAAPTTSNAGPDQTLCLTSPTATLAANTPSSGTGAWSVVTAPGGGSTSSAQFSNTASPTSTFTPSPAVAGAYTLRWTISNAPCTASTDDVVITYRAAPTTSNAGPDQTICTSGAATLAANTPSSGTGAWSVVTAPGGGSTSSTQFSNTASPTSTFTPSPAVVGDYTLRWTISNAPCTASTDDVVITVTQGPTTSNAGPDQTLCVTSPTATLAANTPTTGTGAWSVVTAPGGGSTSSGQFGNTASPTSTFTPSPAVAGAYTLRWTISNAPCPASTDDVVITYNAAPTTSNAGPDQTLCVTSPTATLAANTPTNGTGAWSVVTTPGGGSTSSAQFSNTASPTSTFTPSPAVAGAYTLRWTISNSPCTASTDDVVITYNAAPTTSNAGPDQTLCVTSPAATLAANAPSSGAGVWSVVTAPGGGSTSSGQFGNTASPTSIFTPSPAVAGAYTLRWTISNAPCPASTDDVVITVRANPTTSNAGPDQTVCNGSPATLAANVPSSGAGLWSVVSGPNTSSGQFGNTAVNNTTFTAAGGAGTYTLRWTISNAPCTASTDDVVITVTTGPSPSNAGPDQTICVTGGSLAANTPGSGTGAWSVVSGPSTSTGQFGSTTNPTTSFTPAGGAGTYTLRWTITLNPCPNSTDDVVITVRANPTASNAGPDQTICVTGGILGANSPGIGTGLWSVVSGPSTSTGQFGSTTNPTTTFTPAGGTGTYTLQWTISNAPCANSSDTVVVTAIPQPSASNAGSDQTLCVTTPATLAANVPGIGVGAWSVVSGPSTASSQFGNVAVNNTTFTPAGGAGTYTLRWTISNAPCASMFDDVAITFNGVPTTANAGADLTVCVTSTFTLGGNTPTVGSGQWSVAAGPSTVLSQFSNTAAPNSTFTPAGGVGTYTLRWTISNAPCTASTDDVVVTVQSTCTELSVLYVADTQNHRVQKFDGATWTIVCGNGVPGIAANQCSLPEAVTASIDGTRIYVADTGNNRVTFSTNGGATWAILASSGIALSQVKAPQGLALDASGNLYVSDTGNNRVVRFNGGLPGTGVLLASSGITAGKVSSPRGLAVSTNNTLFVADRNNNRVLQIAAANTVAVADTGTTVMAGPGIGLTQVNLPEGLGLDDAGNLYVADTGNGRVLRLAGGVAPGVVQTLGAGGLLGWVSNPEGVTVSRFTIGPFAGQSLLVVGDTGNNRIQGRPVAGGTFQLVGAPNNLGSFPGMFRSPSKIR